jgi:hypothetical protein
LASCSPRHRIRLAEFRDLLLEACHPLQRLLAPEGTPERERSERRVCDLSNGLIASAYDRERARRAARHRALPDAEAMRRIWLDVVKAAAEIAT